MLSRQDKVKEIKQSCETDLKFLCKNILGMSDWEDELHGDLSRFLTQSGNRKLILMPRGHLKSSIVTVGWAIQQALKNPNIRILITNAVWDKARTLLYQLSSYLVDKSSLPQIYGPFQTPQVRWTRDEIEVAQRTKNTVKEATFTTGGIERSLTGMHFDLIIHDDLVDSTNITTKDQVEKVKSFYRNTLPLLDPGGKIITIGTRWLIGDLYQDLIEQQATSINGKKIKPEERLDWRTLLPK